MKLTGADIGAGSATVLAACVVARVAAAADLSFAATRALQAIVSLRHGTVWFGPDRRRAAAHPEGSAADRRGQAKLQA